MKQRAKLIEKSDGSRLKRCIAIGAVILLPVCACGREDAASAGGLDPDRVVVAVLDNLTGDTSLDAVGRLASNWITVGLEIAGVVHVVPTPTALRASRFVQFEMDSGRVADPVRALAEETGAGHVVFGTYDRENGRLRFEMQVANVGSGEEARALDPVRGAAAKPQEAIEVLRQRVMGFLAVSVDERLAGRAEMAQRPPTLAAYRAFDDGMGEYITFNNATALPHFLRAFELDSTFLVPLVYAGINSLNLRRYRLVDSLVMALEDRAGELSEYDRHWVAYLRARAAGDNEAALQPMRQASAIAPGSKAVYNLAFSLEKTNRPGEALRTMETLDPDRGPMRGFYPYWSRLCTALHMLGDHDRELAVVRSARQRFPQVWELLDMEIRASAAVGNVRAVKHLLDESATLPRAGSASYATAISTAVLELRAHGFVGTALTVNELAIDWFEAQLIDEETGRDARLGAALALYRAERWNAAVPLLEALAAEYSDDAEVLGLFGLVLARLGNHEQARRIEEDLAEMRSLVWQAHITRRRARIEAVLGDQEQAVRLLKEAIVQGLGTDPWLRRDIDFESLHGYPPFEELMRPKG